MFASSIENSKLKIDTMDTIEKTPSSFEDILKSKETCNEYLESHPDELLEILNVAALQRKHEIVHHLLEQVEPSPNILFGTIYVNELDYVQKVIQLAKVKFGTHETVLVPDILNNAQHPVNTNIIQFLFDMGLKPNKRIMKSLMSVYMPPYGYISGVIHNCPEIMNEILRTIDLCVEFGYILDKNDLMFMICENIPIDRKHCEHLLPIDDEIKRFFALHTPSNFEYLQLFNQNSLKLLRKIQNKKEKFTVDLFKQFIQENDDCSVDGYVLHAVLFHSLINLAQFLLQEYNDLQPSVEDVKIIRLFLDTFETTSKNANLRNVQKQSENTVSSSSSFLASWFDDRICAYIPSDYCRTSDCNYLEQKFLKDFAENYKFFKSANFHVEESELTTEAFRPPLREINKHT